MRVAMDMQMTKEKMVTGYFYPFALLLTHAFYSFTLSGQKFNRNE